MQTYERMNIADALVSKQFADEVVIIKQVSRSFSSMSPVCSLSCRFFVIVVIVSIRLFGFLDLVSPTAVPGKSSLAVF